VSRFKTFDSYVFLLFKSGWRCRLHHYFDTAFDCSFVCLQSRVSPNSHSGPLMCNDYGNRVPYSAYLEAFSQLKIRLFAVGGPPNLEPRDDIWPTDVAPIIRAAEDGAELVQLRWGFPPGRPKGPPVINMRSDGRRFQHGRCLVPASHFYEFTGKRSPKDKWRFTKVGEEWFCIAGIWRPVKESAAAFTMLTCEPGPDVAPIHNRQVVVLDRSQWADWLHPTSNEKDLLRSSAAGTLRVEKVQRPS
jgi:putative SOS response-associated peptidase YedK